MFQSTMNKGFHMTFANGNTISVQFGYGNYCNNRNADFNTLLNKEDVKSETAEIAIWDKSGIWTTKDYFPDQCDDVVGYLSADQVLELMNRVAT